MYTPEERIAHLERLNRPIHPKRRAEILGEVTYQGKSCLQGHSGIRYVCNSACVECQKARNKADIDRLRAHYQVYYQKKRQDPEWCKKEAARMKKYAGRYDRNRLHMQAVKENTLAALMGVLG